VPFVVGEEGDFELLDPVFDDPATDGEVGLGATDVGLVGIALGGPDVPVAEPGVV